MPRYRVAMTTGTDLYNRYGRGTRALSYEELPMLVQRALRRFWITEQEFDMSDFKGHRWAYFTVPMDAMIDAVMSDPYDDTPWESTLKKQIKHKHIDVGERKQRWPVLLNCGKYDLIRDGVHRLYTYAARGDKTVPCLIEVGRHKFPSW